MPRNPKTIVELKTITGNQLAHWRVHGVHLSQEDLADWLGGGRRMITAAEGLGEKKISRRLYLACMGLAAEFRQ